MASISALRVLLPDLLAGAAPSQLCQIFFLLAAALVQGLQILPKTSQQLLLNYGPRTRSTTLAEKREKDASQDGRNHNDANEKTRSREYQLGGPLDRLMNFITSYGQTPHSWFNHFYVVSVAGSVFWAWQFVTNGRVMRDLAAWEVEAQTAQSLRAGKELETTGILYGMTYEQVVLTWALMFLQGGRRLYECYFVMRPSKSRMWFVHWLLGISFYLFVGLSVWIEGSDTILNPPPTLNLLKLASLTRTLGVVVFAVGWTQQHLCHKHLASLQKYTLPHQGLFKYIVCAHYYCECLIYLGLARVAAPPGNWLNGTLSTGLIFVAANLGITATGTKQWYAEKFGADSVAGKWKMIPGIW